MVSRNPDTCCHLSPKVATAPPALGLPICELHSALNHGSPPKCQACAGNRDEESMLLPPGGSQSDAHRLTPVIYIPYWA